MDRRSGRLRALLTLGLVGVALAQAAPARADDAIDTGRTDKTRLWHGLAVVAGGALYLNSELVFKDLISPDGCRWCGPWWFDARARRALAWDDGAAADRISNSTAFIAAPLVAAGGLVLSTIDDPSLRRWYDDVVPVLQAGIGASLLNQLVKVIVARERPFVHYGTANVQPENDRYTSFFSGHTTLAFALATSAGTVATLRGYQLAPALWAVGGGLAVATAYLRIGADAHYATDVIAGALIGSAIGVAVPLLLHRDVLGHRGEVAPRIDAAPVGPAGSVGFSLGGSF